MSEELAAVQDGKTVSGSDAAPYGVRRILSWGERSSPKASCVDLPLICDRSHLAKHRIFGITQTRLRLVFCASSRVTLSLRALPTRLTDTHYSTSHPTPEMMVTYLAATPTLEEFSVGFRWQYPESRPLPIDSPRQTVADTRRPTRPQSSSIPRR